MDIWKKIVGQNWAFYSHQKLYDMVKTEATGAGAVSEADQTWREFTEMMARSRDNIERLLSEAGAGWEGLASESMQSGVTPLAQWADDSHTAGTASNGSVQQMGESFSYTANAMPEPVKVTSTANSEWGGIPAAFTHLFGGQTDQDREMQAAQQAKQRAIELMQGYSRNVDSAVSSVGTFIAPQRVTVNVPPPQLAGGSVSYESSSIAGPSTGERRQPAPGPRREDGFPDTHSPVSDPVPVTGSSVPDPSDTAAAPPNKSTETTPGSFIPPTPAPGVVPSDPPVGGPGTRLPDGGFGPVTGFPVDPRTGLPIDPRTGRPLGGGPGSGGGRVPVGPPGSGGGDGEHARGGRGGLTGSVPVEGERAGGVRGGPGMRPSAGAGGAMGPMGAGAGAPREEDKEHRTPEYLRDYHDDWYDLPLTTPPAIGEEDSPRPEDENGGEGAR